MVSHSLVLKMSVELRTRYWIQLHQNRKHPTVQHKGASNVLGIIHTLIWSQVANT